MEQRLRKIGNVPIDVAVLQTMLPARTSFTHFVSKMVDDGELIRLKRGMYVVAPEVSGKTLNEMLIANSLYGPSYVSYTSALHHYGLIDDVAQTVYSATLKREKQYNTPIGRYVYVKLPARYYAIGLRHVEEDGCGYVIASPEKALCDMIINSSMLNLRSQKDALTYLEEDLRFDMERLGELDVALLEECAACGIKSNSINQIIKLIQR